jgi:hypothetical protein
MHNKTVPLLLVLNLLGAVGYLAVASISWTLPAERGLHSTSTSRTTDVRRATSIIGVCAKHC